MIHQNIPRNTGYHSSQINADMTATSILITTTYSMQMLCDQLLFNYYSCFVYNSAVIEMSIFISFYIHMFVHFIHISNISCLMLTTY